MSDLERGAYAPPTDPPLTFDPRQPVRGARPLPFTLIVSILVLSALAAVIFLFYRSGVREAGQAPQVVGTPLDTMTSPAPPGSQPLDPAAGLQIYDADQTAGAPTADPQFTPPPEEPQPRATAQVAAAGPPVAAPPAAIRAAIPAPTTAKPIPPAASPPVVVVTPPAKLAATATPEPQPPTPKPAAASGGAVVQIGAVSSPALADKAWNDAASTAPGLAAGKGKSVEKIEKNGGVLYRTAVTGFASRAEAQTFCAKLQTAGKSCFVR